MVSEAAWAWRLYPLCCLVARKVRERESARERERERARARERERHAHAAYGLGKTEEDGLCVEKIMHDAGPLLARICVWAGDIGAREGC